MGKMALFYGYYNAVYEAEEIKNRYTQLVKGKEAELKLTLEGDPHYSHEASPEIELTEVFVALFEEKGVTSSRELAVHVGQLFRVIATEYVKVLISSDYKTKKPDKRFFDIILDKYNIDVKTALFVGNDSNTDIKGANSVNLDSFYVNSNISPENDSGYPYLRVLMYLLKY